jgi:hypothetical protein
MLLRGMSVPNGVEPKRVDPNPGTIAKVPLAERVLLIVRLTDPPMVPIEALIVAVTERVAAPTLLINPAAGNVELAVMETAANWMNVPPTVRVLFEIKVTVLAVAAVATPDAVRVLPTVIETDPVRRTMPPGERVVVEVRNTPPMSAGINVEPTIRDVVIVSVTYSA